MSWDAVQHAVLVELGLPPLMHVSPQAQLDPRMLGALARAARLDEAALTAHASQWAETKRWQEPAAKKALWPRLRALRVAMRNR